MKTSKYLIIGLVAFVLIAELVLCIDALSAKKSGKGRKNRYPTFEVVEKSKSIKPFSKIRVYSGGVDITVKKSDEYKMKLLFFKDSTVVFPEIKIENGELHLKALSNSVSQNIVLYTPTIDSIVAINKNRINLQGFKAPKLYVELSNGSSFRGDEESDIDNLKLKVLDSRADVYMKCDSLMLISNNSTIYVSKNQHKFIKAILTNKSRVSGGGFKSLTIENDGTSKYNLNN